MICSEKFGLKIFGLLLMFYPFALCANDLTFTNIICDTSNKKSAEIFNCGVNGKFLHFDIETAQRLECKFFNFNILKLFLKYLKVKVDFWRRKKESFYSSIFKFAPVPWCSLNDGTSKFSGFQKTIQGVKQSAPEIFHK